MTSFLVLVLQLGACLGAGALLLRAIGVLDSLDCGDRLSWSFAAGLGVLGWVAMLLALLGWLGLGPLLGLEIILAMGCVFLRLQWPRTNVTLLPWETLLACLVAAVLLMDFVEALAPPVDADTLAYHFARPRQILRDGGVTVIPRAIDGVLPLLLHMTYIPPLALGGEKALTLWMMLSGTAPALLLYTTSRHWLSRGWSLVAVLVVLTTPAWIYGAGTGQVEARIALFAILAALAVAQSVRNGSLSYALLAGVGAGFYAASKYLGLIYVAACALVVVWQRRWLLAGMTYGLAAAIAGGQWYIWNYVQLGDPLFPALFAWLPPTDPHIWNAETDRFLREIYMPVERPVDANLYWLVAYPLYATLAGFPIWESGRTGFGPLGLLLLPFCIGGIWLFRARLVSSTLGIVGLVTAVFYIIWFLAGPSQRLRHLLPVWPLLVLCMLVAAERWARTIGATRPLVAGIAVTLTLQIAVQGLFTINYARRLWNAESREAFMFRNVGNFSVVPWLNSNLTDADKLLMTERQFTYLLDHPAFYAPPAFQAQIDLRDGATDIAGQWRQLRRLGITHMLIISDLQSDPKAQALWRLGHAALEAGCAEIVSRQNVSFSVSRTLPSLLQVQSLSEILRVRPPSCTLDTP